MHQLNGIPYSDLLTAHITEQTSSTDTPQLVPPYSPSVIATAAVTQKVVSEHGGGDDGHDVQETVTKEHGSRDDGCQAEEDKTAEHGDGSEGRDVQEDNVAKAGHE